MLPGFEWTAPPECIGRPELVRAVVAELGRAAFAASGPTDWIMRGRVERTPGGSYEVAVSLDRASGETLGRRSLTSDNRDCRSLDEAIAVMLTIVLNVSQKEAARPEPSPWSYRTALGGFVTVGLLPGVGVELAASGGPALPGVLGLDLEVGVDLGPSREVDEGSVDAQAASARLSVSPVLIGGDAELALRLAAGAGLMQASAAGFFRVEDETRAFVETRTGARFSLPIARPLWLEIAADCGVLPFRPRFMVRNADGSREELFQPSLVFGALGLSLALRP